MKKILIMFIMLVSSNLLAQDKIDRLIEQQAVTNAKLDKLTEQVIELAKQQAITATKVDAMDKRFDGVDKRFDDANRRMDMLFYMMLGIMGGVFGLIGFVVWDRQASIKPILDENKAIKIEIEQLTQRELRHEEAVAKNFKKILEKFPDLAGLA